MAGAGFFTTEKKNDNPILIIDQDGVIGEKLVNKIKDELTVVFVSKLKLEAAENVIPLPFDNNFSKVPDNVYSQIIVIDEEAELSHKATQQVIEKTQKDKTHLFLGVNHAFITDKFFIKTVASNSHVKLGILGDVFDSDRIVSGKSDLGNILANIKRDGRIDIPGDGRGQVFPVFLDDLADAIIQVCFSDFREKTYYILPKNRITFLSFALNLKRVFPEIKLDFIAEEKQAPRPKLLLSGKYILGDNYDLDQRIRKINFDKIDYKEKPRPIKTKNTKNSILLTCIFFLSLLFLPFVTTVSGLWVGTAFNDYAASDLTTGNSLNAEAKAKVSQQLLGAASLSANILKQEISPFANPSFVTGFGNEISRKTALNKLYFNFAGFLNKTNSLLTGKSQNPPNDLSDALVALTYANHIFGLVNQPSNPPGLSSKLANIFSFNSASDNFWSEILGFNGKKNYLIVLEESSQSRSASGLINNYDVISIDKGKISNPGFNDDLSQNASLSAVFSRLEPLVKINGIIVVTNEKSIKNVFTTLSSKASSKKGLLTVDLCDLLISKLRNGHLTLSLDNPAEQAALSTYLK